MSDSKFFLDNKPDFYISLSFFSDMSKVSLNDAEGNIRMALKASETLGVPIVLHPKEIRRTHGPDKLALLTYLHQLRALFTNRQFRLSKIGGYFIL